MFFTPSTLKLDCRVLVLKSRRFYMKKIVFVSIILSLVIACDPFAVPPTQPPVVTPPGGGTVAPPSGPVVPPCDENWRCTAWAVCPTYGIQTRECIDLSECGTTRLKPEESRPCVSVPDPSCNDGILNCHHGLCEILIYCGGPCSTCPTCSDGIRNQGEEQTDCGGPCPPCK